jgi:lipopolysaccharide biosynthesis glycosyltransferase
MTLHIAFSTDDNYAQHLGVSITSLFENNQDFDTIIVHILNNNIAEDNLKKLHSLGEKYGRTIICYDLSGLLSSLNEKFQIPATISISSYSRLFLSTILDTSIEKIIYADCDSLILGSFAQLWQMNIENCAIAAVEDHVHQDNKVAIGNAVDSRYVNAGFLLINLKKWRLINAEEKMINIIKKYNGAVRHHDQGVINATFAGDIYYLHPRYNVMTSFFEFKNTKTLEAFYKATSYYPQTMIDEAMNTPIFVHLTPSFSKRPWIEGSRHPLKHLYAKYLNLSPWKGESLQKDTRSAKLKLLDFIFGTFGYKIYRKLFGWG